eukprot:m.1046570 g.1046570  ORF g.1046570 m.1046570 type:complete len:123 (-) comp24170_c0_seq130:2424-2792(-)
MRHSTTRTYGVFLRFGNVLLDVFAHQVLRMHAQARRVSTLVVMHPTKHSVLPTGMWSKNTSVWISPAGYACSYMDRTSNVSDAADWCVPCCELHDTDTVQGQCTTPTHEHTCNSPDEGNRAE